MQEKIVMEKAAALTISLEDMAAAIRKGQNIDGHKHVIKERALILGAAMTLTGYQANFEAAITAAVKAYLWQDTTAEMRKELLMYILG
jgi:hypothetical protein